MTAVAENRTRRERYAVATSNGQLRVRDDRPTDADTIIAAGAAGAREPLGIAWWRAKYSNDRHAYRHTQSLLMLRVSHVARRRRWGESPKVLKLLAGKVMAWATWGVCPACMGRGHPALDGLPNVLSDDLCHVCHGDGHTSIESAVPPELVGRAKDIAQLLAEADQAVDAVMWARLGQRVAAIVKGD